MSDNLTLDRAEFEELTEQAKLERAEYLRRNCVAALGVVGSTWRAHHVYFVGAIIIISFGITIFF